MPSNGTKNAIIASLGPLKVRSSGHAVVSGGQDGWCKSAQTCSATPYSIFDDRLKTIVPVLGSVDHLCKRRLAKCTKTESQSQRC
jgi:hypothetical protein